MYNENCDEIDDRFLIEVSKFMDGNESIPILTVEVEIWEV